DAGPAFKPGANFAGVVLEALERTEFRSVDDRTFANDANLCVAFENAIDHVAAGNGACALDAESVANFGAAKVRLLENRLEQALHGFFNFVGNFVNDVVGANIHTFLLGEVGGFALGANTERDDDRTGGGSQEHVIFTDRAHTGADDFQFHLIGGKFGKHFAEHFDRALHVGLDHH